MKAKKTNKKLVLNKKTIAVNLEQEQMYRVQGGKPDTWVASCPPNTIRTCASFEFAC